MGKRRSAIENLDELVGNRRKKFVRYDEGAVLYSMGLHSFQELAKEAKKDKQDKASADEIEKLKKEAEEAKKAVKENTEKIADLEQGIIPDFEMARKAADEVNKFNEGISGILGFDPFEAMKRNRQEDD